MDYCFGAYRAPLWRLLAAISFAWLGAVTADAQGTREPPRYNSSNAPSFVRLTLGQAKEQVLVNSKLFGPADVNGEGNEIVTRIVRANYFPKIVGNTLQFNLDEPLGNALTTRERCVLGNPSVRAAGNVLNQNSEFSAAPLMSGLLKIRQGVRVARADEEMVRAEAEKAARALVSAVEQLYWGILATARIRAGAAQAVEGAEQLAKLNVPESRAALVNAKQQFEEVENQLAALQAQFKDLLGIPTGTKLVLVQPQLPSPTFHSVGEFVALALATSPELDAAQQGVVKANATVDAGKVDMVAAANLKLQQTEEEIRQEAKKAYQEFEQHWDALKHAQELVQAREEAVKALRTAATQNPVPLIEATEKLGLAQINLVKAELDFRARATQLPTPMGSH